MSALADRLATVVRSYRYVKVPIEVLTTAAFDYDRALLTEPQRRETIADVLRELVDREVLTLPSRSNARCWDCNGHPPLPYWVKQIRPAKPRPTPPPVRGWVPELASIATIDLSPPLSRPEWDILSTVNNFLRDGGTTAEPVPLRERSAGLFNDDKRLDHIHESRLVELGLLSVEQHLRAFPTSPPLYLQQVGSAHWALIIENSTTFNSLRILLHQKSTRAASTVGWLGYGAGKQFTRSVASLADPQHVIQPSPQSLIYYGDLDFLGLETAERASGRAVAAGLPPLIPAAGLYTALLQRPTREGHAVEESLAHAVARWLPPRLAQAAAQLLADGKCIRQESLSLPMMRQRDCNFNGVTPEM